MTGACFYRNDRKPVCFVSKITREKHSNFKTTFVTSCCVFTEVPHTCPHAGTHVVAKKQDGPLEL